MTFECDQREILSIKNFIHSCKWFYRPYESDHLLLFFEYMLVVYQFCIFSNCQERFGD